MKETKMVERVMAGKAAASVAIRVKCLECCGWRRFDGGVDHIGGCTVKTCPLWAYRPFRPAGEGRAKTRRQRPEVPSVGGSAS